MNLKKTSVIFTIFFVIVFAVGTLKGLEGKSYNDGPGVEEIYQSIRYAAPQYDRDESIVTFENEGMNIVCTLTIPISQQKCPIIITLTGFLGTRDGDPIPGTNEKAFQRTSRILAEQGIASLRMDFRGSGESDGEFQITTFSTQISDTIAAVDYIENNLKHQINTKSIGIIGFSQGSLVGAVAASRDSRLDSLVLWSPVASPAHCYQGLLTAQGIKDGLALPDGGFDMFGIYINGEYINLDVPLGKGFFEDLFNMNPLAEVRKCDIPLMVAVGNNDIIIWPQPAKGELYMTYHDGYEKLITIDGDHSFDAWAGPEKLDDVICWGTAWFIKTLNVNSF